MSNQDRLMVNFTLDRLCLYRADIVAVSGAQTPEEFAVRNQAVITRIKSEVYTLFHYELSREQVECAIDNFLSQDQSGAKTVSAATP